MQLRPTALCENSFYLVKDVVLLLDLTVTVHEAVYATCCIDKLALTCIERVRCA